MLKNICYVGLAFIMLFHSLGRQAWTYLYFKANQNYFATFLCENRDKPELNCKGHCCLKKQLKADDEREQKVPTHLKFEHNDDIIMDMPNACMPLAVCHDIYAISTTAKLAQTPYSAQLYAGMVRVNAPPPQQV